jgi:hypothetical protein
MYLLIQIGLNGERDYVFASKTKVKLEDFLKDKGYYFSKRVGLYINDKTVNIKGGSGIDYDIKFITEL